MHDRFHLSVVLGADQQSGFDAQQAHHNRGGITTEAAVSR